MASISGIIKLGLLVLETIEETERLAKNGIFLLEAEMGVQVKSSTPEVVVKVVTADIDTKEGRNSIAFSQSVGHHVIYRRKRV